MDLDVTAAKTKFQYVGEILPNNERSNAIIAQRREEEQRKREEAERVSYLWFSNPVEGLRDKKTLTVIVYRLSSNKSWERRKERRRREKKRKSNFVIRTMHKSSLRDVKRKRSRWTDSRVVCLSCSRIYRATIPLKSTHYRALTLGLPDAES